MGTFKYRLTLSGVFLICSTNIGLDINTTYMVSCFLRIPNILTGYITREGLIYFFRPEMFSINSDVKG